MVLSSGFFSAIWANFSWGVYAFCPAACSLTMNVQHEGGNCSAFDADVGQEFREPVLHFFLLNFIVNCEINHLITCSCGFVLGKSDEKVLIILVLFSGILPCAFKLSPGEKSSAG
ncbi:MAG: hypothetical protein MZV63_09710 [Marinilabiliales bacterium]|nr:hypothetical protein [Marinilabiliales bacterium]